MGAEFELSRLLLTFRRAARGGSWGPRGPRRKYHPPSRARCAQPRRVASFECTVCKRNRASSVMDEMWARAAAHTYLWSFIRLVPMCRRGAALPDRLVVLQACAQRDSKCARLGRACICLLQKPAAS